jgi:hypothetical protein
VPRVGGGWRGARRQSSGWPGGIRADLGFLGILRVFITRSSLDGGLKYKNCRNVSANVYSPNLQQHPAVRDR